MWEWSNRLLRKKDSEESKSLLVAYNDLLLQNAYAPEPLKKKRFGTKKFLSGNNAGSRKDAAIVKPAA